MSWVHKIREVSIRESNCFVYFTMFLGISLDLLRISLITLQHNHRTDYRTKNKLYDRTVDNFHEIHSNGTIWYVIYGMKALFTPTLYSKEMNARFVFKKYR